MLQLFCDELSPISSYNNLDVYIYIYPATACLKKVLSSITSSNILTLVNYLISWLINVGKSHRNVLFLRGGAGFLVAQRRRSAKAARPGLPTPRWQSPEHHRRFQQENRGTSWEIHIFYSPNSVATLKGFLR